MPWRWIIVSLLTAGAVALVVCLYRQDRRQAGSRIRDTLSPTVAREIAQEREAALQRRGRFAAALREASREHRK